MKALAVKKGATHMAIESKPDIKVPYDHSGVLGHDKHVMINV